MADKQADPKSTGSSFVKGTDDTKPKAFDAQGSIGKHFTTEGAVGGTAEKIGGPLSKEGMIGKQFTTEGSLGGSVQDKMGGEKKA